MYRPQQHLCFYQCYRIITSHCTRPHRIHRWSLTAMFVFQILTTRWCTTTTTAYRIISVVLEQETKQSNIRCHSVSGATLLHLSLLQSSDPGSRRCSPRSSPMPSPPAFRSRQQESRATRCSPRSSPMPSPPAFRSRQQESGATHLTSLCFGRHHHHQCLDRRGFYSLQLHPPIYIQNTVVWSILIWPLVLA